MPKALPERNWKGKMQLKMYSSQIKRQLTDMPRYPRTPGFQINVGAWSKPQAKGTASPSTLSMLANRGTKPQISTSKLETSSSENVSLKNVEKHEFGMALLGHRIYSLIYALCTFIKS